MAYGAWSPTACLRADIHNIGNKDPYSPDRFNPFAGKRPRPRIKPRPGAVEALARDLCGDEACDAQWGQQHPGPTGDKQE